MNDNIVLDSSSNEDNTDVEVMARVPTTTIHVLVHHEKHSHHENMRSSTNFKRWQQKMFYLTMLNVTKFLTESASILDENEADVQKVMAYEVRKHSEFLCRNYVLNDLTDALYNMYSTIKSTKELWELLNQKYKTEDVGAKKFLVGRFLDFKMVDFKTVFSQLQEIQVILYDILTEGMVLNESFQVATIIEKLPPS